MSKRSCQWFRDPMALACSGRQPDLTEGAASKSRAKIPSDPCSSQLSKPCNHSSKHTLRRESGRKCSPTCAPMHHSQRHSSHAFPTHLYSVHPWRFVRIGPRSKHARHIASTAQRSFARANVEDLVLVKALVVNGGSVEAVDGVSG